MDFAARVENLLDPPCVCADNERLRNATGWRMRYGLRDGLEQTEECGKNRG